MNDDAEARARAPAGPDGNELAATAEVVSPRDAEKGATSCLPVSRPAATPFKVGNLAQAPGHP